MFGKKIAMKMNEYEMMNKLDKLRQLTIRKLARKVQCIGKVIEEETSVQEKRFEL